MDPIIKINRIMTRGTQRVQSFVNLNWESKVSQEKPVQLGLCCVNITLKSQKVFAGRKMIQRTIREKGLDPLKQKILMNLQDILTMMKWNDLNGIRVFRLTSDIFPHKTNPNIENYSFDFAQPLLEEIGNLSKLLEQRITFHPGQHNVIGTPHEDVFKRTQEDLEYHAEMLDRMGLGPDSVMVVHAGGFFGDREKTINRWCVNYQRLSQRVKKRLVLENCEKSFNIEHCLQVNRSVGIPIVLDIHHFHCYQLLHPNDSITKQDITTYIPKVLETWRNRGIKPKFHISQQGPGRIGHHSDYIDEIPTYLLNIPKQYNTYIDIMVEAKKKELAIHKLYERHPELDCRV